MNDLFIGILRWILKTLARLTIWRYRPGVIGVTGSVGKTSTKLAIAAVLSEGRRVRVSSGNLNNELGVALTVLGDWSPEELRLVSRDTPPGAARLSKLFFWIKVISMGAWRALVRDRAYPDILILEYGADRPGDIKRLLRIVRPNVSVVTAIGEYPVHVEYYENANEVAREKGRLIESLPSAGFAILNADDARVMKLEPRTRGRVMTFGFEKDAEVKLSRFENRASDARPEGVGFRIEFSGSSVPIRIPEVFGKVQAYASGAAAAVGLIFGMNLVKIAEALGAYRPADSRMQLIQGIKRTLVIDDSYNASPLSMQAALETLAELPAKRRIAVLGDMLELGEHTLAAHEEIGCLAARSADLLFTVGLRAKFIAEAAARHGMKRSNILSYDTADEARIPVQNAMREGDLVLVKGSHAMELDKIVEEVKDMTPSSSSLV